MRSHLAITSEFLTWSTPSFSRGRTIANERQVWRQDRESRFSPFWLRACRAKVSLLLLPAHRSDLASSGYSCPNPSLIGSPTVNLCRGLHACSSLPQMTAERIVVPWCCGGGGTAPMIFNAISPPRFVGGVGTPTWTRLRNRTSSKDAICLAVPNDNPLRIYPEEQNHHCDISSHALQGCLNVFLFSSEGEDETSK